MANIATIGQLELVYTKSMSHLATIGQLELVYTKKEHGPPRYHWSVRTRVH